jgi:hypothetical protein
LRDINTFNDGTYDIFVNFVFFCGKLDQLSDTTIRHPQALLNLFEPKSFDRSAKLISIRPKSLGDIERNQMELSVNFRSSTEPIDDS